MDTKPLEIHITPVPQPWAPTRVNWAFIAVWAPTIAGWVSLAVWILR